MANDEESQGGTYNVSEDDILALMNEAAKRGADEALRNAAYTRQIEQDDEDMGDNIVNPKIVKQLKDTVTIFNTLKEMSSNPMQKTIEQTVGGLVAGVIQDAFARPSGPPPKRDIVDTLLNSQFAFGLGSSLGQRAPELIESMGKTFGAEKTEEIVDSMIDKYAGGRGREEHSVQSRSLNPPESEGSSSLQSEDTSNLELLLSLDPNNPEHVAAYAESQGGVSIDVARKMLMIHQDDIIKQMKAQGIDTQNLESIRGSRTRQEQMPPETMQQEQMPPETMQQEQMPPEAMQQEQMPPEAMQQEQMSPEAMQQESQYVEYENVAPQNTEEIDNDQTVQDSNSPQPEILKKFAEDIGKVMGNMIDKIESLNDTVQTLQNELNEIKKEGTPYQPEEISDQTYEPSPVVVEPAQSSEEFFREPDVKTPEEFEAELRIETERTIEKAKEEHIEVAPTVPKEKAEDVHKEKSDIDTTDEDKKEDESEELLSEDSYIELDENIYVEQSIQDSVDTNEKDIKNEELRDDKNIESTDVGSNKFVTPIKKSDVRKKLVPTMKDKKVMTEKGIDSNNI